MENKAKSALTNIERVLNSEQLMEEQKQTLIAFDRYNELENLRDLSVWK
ncbi:MAG: hypothetical protein H3Z54_09460 [archaeon]|nr:hypothetical protein [archaeon]